MTALKVTWCRVLSQWGLDIIGIVTPKSSSNLFISTVLSEIATAVYSPCFM